MLSKRDFHESAGEFDFCDDISGRDILRRGVVKTAKLRIVLVDKTVWHIGASLKDAGSALFAVMKMELDPAVILGLLP